jgi:SAM-dependent methyltransferase
MTMSENEMNADEARRAVRDHYGKIGDTKAPAARAPGCCGSGAGKSELLGYSPEELAAVPDGADLGLGCGNPQQIAALREGETVVDLGSGGAFDCLLAARKVGPTGHVIGVDMTSEMIERARANVKRAGATNVEIRLGEIEHLPIADGVVDVILSNCVINLVPDKAQAFREAFRILRPGGRIAISDVVTTAPLPPELRAAVDAYTGCVSGAAAVDELHDYLGAAGFVDVEVAVREESRAVIADWFPGTGAEKYVASASIEARRPVPGEAAKPRVKLGTAICAPGSGCC